MFVFFIVNFMARSFIGERDMGTLNRLRMAPISRPGMMIGKTVPFLVISLVQTALLFLAGKLLFKMSWGPEPWLLLPVMFCTSLAATSLGLMVATLVRTEAQVSAYGNFLVLTMAGISGCMMPRTWQPELMQQVGLVTPHAWALIAYEQILSRENPELSVVWRSCEILLAFAGGFFAVGWWRARDLD
jgi:ABC-2 type transport system permease protein